MCLQNRCFHEQTSFTLTKNIPNGVMSKNEEEAESSVGFF